MCQISKTNKLTLTKKDIICYKTFISKERVEEELVMFPNKKYIYTRFKKASYEIGKLKTVDADYIVSKIFDVHGQGLKFKVNIGLHAYCNKKSANNDISYTNAYENYQCTIPAGSHVIRGKFGDDNSIVSDQLIVNFKL